MPTREDLKNIANVRFKEVKALYNSGLYDGAHYLSGYVIETALKARICKILDTDYPDTGDISKSYLTHKFDQLVKLGGLVNTLDRELTSNVKFKTNWSLVTGWTESFRYNKMGTSSQTVVRDIINALEDKTDGVLTWIKKRW